MFAGLIFKQMSDGTKYVEVSLSTVDNSIVEKIDTYIKSIIIKRKTDGIFVISTKKTGLSLHSLGKLNYNFIKENYEEGVLSAYDYITAEYSKAQPYGRLSIVNGPPGTGKTNLIKGIISSVKNCLIVLLPAKFVSEVDSPALVTLLTEEKSDRYGTFNMKSDSPEEEDNSSRPILFIIEDADSCLVPRDGSNVSMISSLLNYTDGIFGSMLDLRIIATTNAEKMEFDEALLRPGRLCRHVTVGEISAVKASEIYKRLTGKDKEYQGKTTLARVYADAQGKFKDAEIEKSAPVGFGK
jgi:ATP-dependent 26S proteasome regulatory subunit